MPIRIDGTNTAANPGITGTDADTGLQFGTDEVKIVTGGTDRIVTGTDIVFKNASGTERMQIAANGYVTKANCAAVRVGRANTTATITPQNKYQFNIKTGYHFDADDLWDTTNHRYTAPVDGLYSVACQIITESNSNGANLIDLINARVNNVNLGYSIRRAEYVSTTTGQSGYFTDFFYGTYELAAGDQVDFRNGSPSTVVMHDNSNYSVVNIYLIG
jgi:hypothetical protein